MMMLLIVLALAATAGAWLAGHQKGYALGVQHGIETGRTESVHVHLPLATDARTVANAFVVELDRKRSTLGLNATRAGALERM